MIEKKYLDKMYHRLWERKHIRFSSNDESVSQSMKEAELAIEMSIKDYIDTHQRRIEGDGE